ncbi:MAG: hypothetical protein KF805_05545 [Phycisphaeraceae bacterium]|nr:hypothetical protein [Phycisphaeraceae bacterium]
MQTPLNPLQLSAFLHQHLNLSVASRALIEGHQAPFEYLVHAFFQGRGGFGVFGLAKPARALDSVVWASRGGGKTFLGAVATALDLAFKPGIEIRILGGSLDQSRRMHAHLRRLFAKEPLADLIEGRIGESRLALKNGSVVELLAQSHTAVRGTRVQTLRCDEAELFKEDVLDAAMLATVSKTIDIPGVGPTEIAGSIECLSTMHVPFGLMSRLVKDNTRRVFKWGVVDVLAECEETRECGECELWTECRGKAKRNAEGAKGQSGKEAEGEDECGVRKSDCGVKTGGDAPASAPVASLAARSASDAASVGHLSIDDAVRMKRRVSLPVWNTEMLCLEPSRADTVFPEFDPRKHVFRDWADEELFREDDKGRALTNEERNTARKAGATSGGVNEQAAALVLARREQERRSCGELWVCGIDFGFRAPTVILWGAVEAHTRVLRILDERILERATTREHVEAIFKGNGRGWKLPDFVGVDPAGRQVNGQTGVRDADVYRESGLDVHTRSLGIGSGLHLIRARLAPAEGPVRLFVHVRCRGLIEALTKYHYRVDRPEDLEPVKDGSDHAVDALRYMVLNLDLQSRLRCERYAG